MNRLYTFVAVLPIAFSSAAFGADQTLLSFDTALPNSLNDANGQGTGFAHRLPGSGSSIPVNDSNLVLNTVNGHLLINSTRSDFNQNGLGQNLPLMETASLLLNGVGSQDFEVEAKFLNLHVDDLSDQAGVFIGSSVNNSVRAGVLEHQPSGSYQSFFCYNLNGVDTANSGGTIGAFSAGQDAIFRIGRTNGVWHFHWENLTNPLLSGGVEDILIPNLDAENDLYVGIFNNDSLNFVAQTQTLDYFLVTVPEPSSSALGLCGVAIVGLRRVARRSAPRTDW